MRVGVIGAGAVGGAIAALLARGGHQVEVTARGEHLASIRKNGIRLTGAWGDYTAVVEAAETLRRGPELVIVAAKAQDAVAAIRGNARFLGGIPILIVQNGLDGVSNAQAAAPQSDVVGALAMFASSFLSPGTITITTAGHTYLGGGNGEHDVPTRYVAGILAEVMPVSVVQNFVGAQWTKLVVNQINALPAISGLNAQDVIGNSALRRIMTASIRENVRVGLRSGIRFETLHGLSHRRLQLFSLLPLWIGQCVPLLMKARMGRTPNPGSTLQSIRRGQSTEIDYLNGAVVRAAKSVGWAAPVNAALVQLVHEVEKSGEFLRPDEIVRRVSHPPVE